MKKRILSCLMALALCLTLLPTAALAEGTEGTAQAPTAAEEPADPVNGEPKQEQENQQETSAAKQDKTVANLQAMIDALPDAEELDGMDGAALNAVYEAFQAACGAYYDTLTKEQQARLENTEKLAALSDWFSQPASTGGVSFVDVPADAYYADAVAWAVENGITTGIGNGLFGADKICTRAQIAAFLARSLK